MDDTRPIVEGEIIKLDYATLQDTIFRNCKMIYGGGRPPTMINCVFDACEFIFEGPALNTQMFMASLANGGAEDLIIGTMLGLPNWGPKGDQS
ncbi:MAG: hypothetical protein NXH97_18210 [Rhodobacteraceae bacterium]|nr:hypothetical protein [Paracoccaceae bacterium]